ncbi:MAG: hypothetical protein KGZ82_09745 [Bacteroidales bacterium]|nr:hypothetical protein [Bacteroidales bacterium]
MKHMFTLLLLMLLAAACRKSDNIVSDKNNYLLGCWVGPVYADSLVTFTRAQTLPDDGYGIVFQSDQQFIERKNAGWCGTPPITYANYTGNWTLTDSIVDISVPYWGGSADYRWKLLSVDAHTLRVYTIAAEYQ